MIIISFVQKQLVKLTGMETDCFEKQCLLNNNIYFLCEIQVAHQPEFELFSFFQFFLLTTSMT